MVLPLGEPSEQRAWDRDLLGPALQGRELLQLGSAQPQLWRRVVNKRKKRYLTESAATGAPSPLRATFPHPLPLQKHSCYL